MENAEAAWRQALNTKGRDWVVAELRRRVGQPNDVVLDVVYEEPYPTREFCQKWCSEQDNRMFHLSGHTIAIIVAALLVVAFGLKAIDSWDSMSEPAQPTMAR